MSSRQLNIAADAARTGSRVPWMDYLRGFITLLVVAHHSSLAYTTFASFHKDAYILSTHPIVDTTRSAALDIFEDFNDIFFMSLMFLISGTFVIRSLEQKGPRLFIRDRFYRLLLPFLIGVTILMPIAYYPAWLEAHGDGGSRGGADILHYLVDFFTVEAWPVGPPWFLWVLFAFNLLFAWIFPYIRDLLKWAGTALPRVRTGMELLLLGYIITWLLYVPLMLWTGPDSWTGIGPFDLQTSRILLYFGYFLLGTILGSQGLRDGIFSEGSMFMRKWYLWLGGSVLVFVVLKCSVMPLRWMLGRQMINIQRAQWLYRSLWCFSCVVSCMAALAAFRRLFPARRKFWDSLSAHAYPIYLLHYIFVIWGQWLLLDVHLPAALKFFTVFVASVIASWGLAIGIGRLAAEFRRSRLFLRPWYTK